MPPLAHAWLLLTACLISPGFIIRWHLLSFFFNPLWLVPCQIFLWLKTLRKWILVILVLPFKFVVVYYIFPVYKLLVARLFRGKGSTESSVWPEESMDCEYSDNEEEDFYRFIPGIEFFRCFEDPPLISEYARIEGVQNVVEERLNTGEQGVDESWEESVQEANNELANMGVEEAMNESARTQGVPEVGEEEFVAADANQNEMVEENRNSTENEDTAESIDDTIWEAASYEIGRNVVDRISITDRLIFQRGLEVEEEREAVDQFYQEYRERMAQFNRLNEDYTNNLRAILTRLVWNSELPQTFAGLVSVLFDNSESDALTRKFIKDVRAKVEMVYVGQTCLCSEALQYQYRKIEEMVFSSPARIPYNRIAAKFLHFRILLDRFMEDESMRGERFWNYSQARLLQYKDLLLVPSLSDQPEADRTGGEKTDPKVLLNIVEDCIIAFLKFLENDLKKPSVSLQKFRRGLRKFLLWDEAQVEDANDLKRLSEIKSALREKEAALKRSLQPEKRPSVFKRKRSNRIQDWYRVEYLCCSIDMKLVSRVLAMPLVSTKQLQWCKHVLENIQFDGGQLKRSRVDLLFPCP